MMWMKRFSILIVLIMAMFGLAFASTSATWCHDELAYPSTIFGSDEADFLPGTPADQKFCGLAGEDSIQAGGGNDFVDGQEDNDVIEGEAGHDVLQGGSGNDTIFGGTGVDVIFGGAGDDELFGGPENDEYLYGLGDGHDTIEDCEGSNSLVLQPSLETTLSAQTIGNDRILTITHPNSSGSIKLVNYELGCSQLTTTYRAGDTNGDGGTSTGDWIYWLRAYADVDVRESLADVQPDGVLNAVDARCLQAQQAVTNASCEQLIDISSSLPNGFAVEVGEVIVPAGANAITVPISFTTTASVSSVLFALDYDTSKLTLGSTRRDSVVAWNVAPDSVAITNAGTPLLDGTVDFLLVAPTDETIASGAIATVTFQVVDPPTSDETVIVTASTGPAFGTELAESAVTLRSQSTLTPTLEMLLLLGLLGLVTLRLVGRKNHG